MPTENVKKSPSPNASYKSGKDSSQKNVDTERHPEEETIHPKDSKGKDPKTTGNYGQKIKR